MCGGTLVEPGELFSEAGFQNIGDLLHNGAWGNLDRAGGTFFSGAGSQNNGEILHNGGGTWPGPGELFFWVSLHLTLTKARTPTARRC